MLSREQNGRVLAGGKAGGIALGDGVLLERRDMAPKKRKAIRKKWKDIRAQKSKKLRNPELQWSTAVVCCNAGKHKVLGGADGARTRDPRRDRPVF